MNPEKKALWVAALRSGRFPQVRGSLHTLGGYCCLGVACEIYNPRIWGNEPVDGEYGIMEDGFNTNYLPRNVMDAFGLHTKDPDLEIDTLAYHSTRLSSLNDNGLTFPQIADLIEHFL